jgi:hypothetical protein
MPATLSDALWTWRLETAYQGDEDHVFADRPPGEGNLDRWWSRHWRAALKSVGRLQGRGDILVHVPAPS